MRRFKIKIRGSKDRPRLAVHRTNNHIYIQAIDDKELKKRKNNRTKRNQSSIKWIERVIEVKRVTKVVKGGKKLSFRVVVVVGNGLGKVGIGVTKADDVTKAVQKAINNGRKSLIVIPLTSNKTIPHIINGKFGASSLILRPAAPGSGVIAGGSSRIVLEAAGVQNILAKRLGSNNLLNNAKATLNALENLKTLKQIANQRDLALTHFYS